MFKKFKGVGLDVTDPEPLEYSKSAENVLSLVKGLSDKNRSRSYHLIKGIKRYILNRPLLNIVDKNIFNCEKSFSFLMRLINMRNQMRKHLRIILHLRYFRLEKLFFEEKKGKVLEYAFGSGCNTKFFLKKNYKVYAIGRI